MKKVFRCFLRTLSPIHVGCDEVYEPMGFVMDEAARQLTVFDRFQYIRSLEKLDKEKFSEICKKGTILSILEIYKFFQGRQAQGRAVRVCYDMVAHYRETLSLPMKYPGMVQKKLNQFKIERTSFNTFDQRPYIPGSAIKGALRTAYLNHMAKGKKPAKFRGKGAEMKMERMLLDSRGIESDPFRMVQVSDFRLVEDAVTRVIYAVNEKKMPSDFEARGPYQILEVIEPGAIFTGEITIEPPHRNAPIKASVPADDTLFKSSEQFYLTEKKREDRELKQIRAGISPGSSGEKMCLIRLGRHSGAESVTVDGYRCIKIMGKNGKKLRDDDHATTLWLASEFREPKDKRSLRPFGWAELCELTPDQAEIFQRRRQTPDEKRKEAEQKKAAFEAMSPEERDIETFNDPNIPENRVVEIYNRIDESSEENKRKLALRLKEYWMKKDKKWKKKECSKKQWKKVQKIKEILG